MSGAGSGVAGGRRLRADAQRNRQAIVEAAEAEFRERGVEASIDGIAERAGVGVGTVYRNYATKDALMRAVVAARIAPLLAAAHEALADPDPGAAFAGFVRLVSSESCEFKAIGDSLAGAGFDLATAKQEQGLELIAAVGTLFERAQQAGALRADVTGDDLRALMMGLSATAHATGDPGQVARCAELVCDALKRTP